MPEVQNATSADAQLILQLYDLRRESEMRKARKFFETDFWPRTFEDFTGVALNFGSPQNAYFRQVVSYWDMAASLVLCGTLNERVFFLNNGEMFFVYAKIKPFLKQARDLFNWPEFLASVEKLAEATPDGRARLERIQANFAKWAEMRERLAAQQGSAAQAS